MTESPDTSSSPQRVECGARREPAVKNAIVAVILVGFGVYCHFDAPRFPRPADWSLKNANAVLGYVLNHWGPWAMVPGGGVVLLWTGLRYRRRLVADEAGAGYVGGPRIAWERVDSLDARRLQSKGIVVLHAGDRRLVLDSYYLRNFRELVALVERRVPAEKHVLK